MLVLSDTDYKAAVLTKRRDICKRIGNYEKKSHNRLETELP